MFGALNHHGCTLLVLLDSLDFVYLKYPNDIIYFGVKWVDPCFHAEKARISDFSDELGTSSG